MDVSGPDFKEMYAPLEVFSIVLSMFLIMSGYLSDTYSWSLWKVCPLFRFISEFEHLLLCHS